ncbi:MAG: hypothetical protein Crog4KO_18560 [Crocinitomicaceae bacterium]
MRFSIVICCLVFHIQTWAQQEISHPSGVYAQPFELEIAPSKNQQIYFTTDGSDPVEKGTLYDVPIAIGSESTVPPAIDQIPTTPEEGPWQLSWFQWKRPKPTTPDVWIVRYCIFENEVVKATETLTYFIGKHWKKKHDFPVISLVTDRENLFSADSGIFVPGDDYTLDGWDSTFFGNGNYTKKGKLWERDVHFHLFDTTMQSKQQYSARMRLHGAVVGVLPQKSMRIYTDKTKDGRPLQWQFLNATDSLESARFVLRNSGSDFVSTHFRDAFLGTVAADLGLEHQKTAPVVVYINGIYWGVFNIRERIDRFYMQNHFGLDREAYDMIEGTGSDVLNGSNQSYIDILTLLYKNDASEDSVFALVEKALDIDNYIDYTLFETYFCNMDWPGNNVKFWRPKEGKWRWIFFDGDLMMSKYVFNGDGGYEHNALAHAMADTNNQWYNSKGSTYLLRNLMKNASFRDRFVARYHELSETLFSENYLLELLDSFHDEYASEMPRQIDRWGYPQSMAEWSIEVEKLKRFVRERGKYFEAHLEAQVYENKQVKDKR